MFSWSKKKDTRRRGRPDRDSEENEFGVKIDRGQDDKQLEAELKRLAGVDSFPEDDLNEGEDDVELELQRLMGGGGKGKRATPKPTSPDEPIGDITALTAEIDLGEEDIEVDENDPELLNELLSLTSPDDVGLDEEPDEESEPESEEKAPSDESDVLSTLKERLKMYKTAEAKAKESNESSRARRFARGIKTLEDLLKKAKAGKPVSPGDIPPVIALNLKPAPPPQPPVENGNEETMESEEPQRFENGPHSEPASKPENIIDTLMERLKLYKTAEAKAKESGETTRARRFNRGIKTLESLLKEARAGKPVAPEDIPPVVALNLKPAPPPQPTPEENPDDNSEQVEEEMENINPESYPDDSEPEKPQEEEKDVMTVLVERLQLYKTAEANAKEKGETSRARRFGRGIKTLQDLIKQASAGKPIAPDDIPPVIALNLKPAPPVVTSEIVEAKEEVETREGGVERETLVQSLDPSQRPLSFAPVDDVDLEEELIEDTPTTVVEGLEQRVRLYTKFLEKAREEGNMDLVERNGKIVKVYLNALNVFKRGGYVDVENLPNPNGCPPIPIPFYVS